MAAFRKVSALGSDMPMYLNLPSFRNCSRVPNVSSSELDHCATRRSAVCLEIGYRRLLHFWINAVLVIQVWCRPKPLDCSINAFANIGGVAFNTSVSVVYFVAWRDLTSYLAGRLLCFRIEYITKFRCKKDF